MLTKWWGIWEVKPWHCLIEMLCLCVDLGFLLPHIGTFSVLKDTWSNLSSFFYPVESAQRCFGLKASVGAQDFCCSLSSAGCLEYTGIATLCFASQIICCSSFSLPEYHMTMTSSLRAPDYLTSRAPSVDRDTAGARWWLYHWMSYLLWNADSGTARLSFPAPACLSSHLPFSFSFPRLFMGFFFSLDHESQGYCAVWIFFFCSG